MDDPTTRYLKEIVLPTVETAYTSTIKVVNEIDSLGDGATISLVSFEHFARDYAQLILAVDKLVSDNDSLRAEIAAHVVLTKLNNALTLLKNVAALQEVDPAMIAAVLQNVRHKGILRDSLALLSVDALQMLKDALEEVDNGL